MISLPYQDLQGLICLFFLFSVSFHRKCSCRIKYEYNGKNNFSHCQRKISNVQSTWVMSSSTVVKCFPIMSDTEIALQKNICFTLFGETLRLCINLISWGPKEIPPVGEIGLCFIATLSHGFCQGGVVLISVESWSVHNTCAVVT